MTQCLLPYPLQFLRNSTWKKPGIIFSIPCLQFKKLYTNSLPYLNFYTFHIYLSTSNSCLLLFSVYVCITITAFIAATYKFSETLPVQVINIVVFFNIPYKRVKRRKWQPTPVFLHEKSNEQRNLEGYSAWGRKKSDMTKQLSTHRHTEETVNLKQNSESQNDMTRGCHRYSNYVIKL